MPDGSYTLLVSSVPISERRGGPGNPNAGVLAGSVDVTVAGRAVPNLRLAMSAGKAEPGETDRAAQCGVFGGSRSDGGAGKPGRRMDRRQLWSSAYARGAPLGPRGDFTSGRRSYWVHTSNQGGLCEASFTAGGANLAREPVTDRALRLGGAHGIDDARRLRQPATEPAGGDGLDYSR